MASSITRIVIFDQGLYHGNGDVIAWMRKITAKFAAEAILAAPVRSGELRAGIDGSVRFLGQRQLEGAIRSRARHTMYVLRGTTGPISTNRYFANPSGATRLVWGYTNIVTGKVTRKSPGPGARRKQHPVGVKGYWMKIPAEHGFPTFYATEVSGQAAQNFLLEAWIKTARNHKALRGPIPAFIAHP